MRAALLLSTALVACTSVVPSTVLQLRRLSPIDTDPAAITVLLTAPPGLGIAEGSPVLRLAAVRSETEQSTEGLFILARGQAGEADTFRIAQEDLDRFRALQNQIRDWKTEDDDGIQGQFTIDVEGCRIGPGPAPGAPLSISMQIEEGGPVLLLIRPTPVERVLKVAGVEDLPPC